MKKTLILALSILTASVSAQSIKTPAPSPGQTIKQDFALSSIEVAYSRPAMKGRTIFGDLVPFDKMWRTGANSQTTVTFGEDVKVAGKDLKAGKYSIVTIPGRTDWEVIFCTPQTSAFNYKTADEVARIKVQSITLPFSVENFMIIFGTQTDNTTSIDMLWDKTMVSIPVSADIETKIMADIDKALNKDNKPYYAAAAYYFDNGKDNTKALEWATKAVEAQPEAYWVAHLKAKVQAKAGDKKGAIATAMKSMELAKKGGNADYVALNEKLIASLK